MKRLQAMGVVALAAALVLITVAAQAQERQGRRGGGRGGPGGFGGFGGAGGGSLLALVRSDAVQAELKLDDAKKAEVAKVAEELQGQFGGGPGGRGQGGPGQGGPGGGDFQARIARMQEQARQAEENLKAVLSAEQMTRLKQIRWQFLGVLGAAQDAELASALSLDDATKEKLVALNTEQREAMRDLREAVQDGSVQREAMASEMEKVRKELEDKALALLTADQKAKYTELVGAPFDVSSLRARGFGPGGGRGRRGA